MLAPACQRKPYTHSVFKRDPYTRQKRPIQKGKETWQHKPYTHSMLLSPSSVSPHYLESYISRTNNPCIISKWVFIFISWFWFFYFDFDFSTLILIFLSWFWCFNFFPHHLGSSEVSRVQVRSIVTEHILLQENTFSFLTILGAAMLAGSRYVSSPRSEREIMVLPVHTTPTCTYTSITIIYLWAIATSQRRLIVREHILQWGTTLWSIVREHIL